jgi:hypothetical protein
MSDPAAGYGITIDTAKVAALLDTTQQTAVEHDDYSHAEADCPILRRRHRPGGVGTGQGTPAPYAAEKQASRSSLPGLKSTGPLLWPASCPASGCVSWVKRTDEWRSWPDVDRLTAGASSPRCQHERSSI